MWTFSYGLNSIQNFCFFMNFFSDLELDPSQFGKDRFRDIITCMRIIHMSKSGIFKWKKNVRSTDGTTNPTTQLPSKSYWLLVFQPQHQPRTCPEALINLSGFLNSFLFLGFILPNRFFSKNWNISETELRRQFLLKRGGY